MPAQASALRAVATGSAAAAGAAVSAALSAGFLYFDPDSGDTIYMMAHKGGYRPATADDFLEAYVERMQPLDESCEFDTPRN